MRWQIFSSGQPFHYYCFLPLYLYLFLPLYPCHAVCLHPFLARPLQFPLRLSPPSQHLWQRLVQQHDSKQKRREVNGVGTGTHFIRISAHAEHVTRTRLASDCGDRPAPCSVLAAKRIYSDCAHSEGGIKESLMRDVPRQ
jgi:hypothetical protein